MADRSPMDILEEIWKLKAVIDQMVIQRAHDYGELEKLRIELKRLQAVAGPRDVIRQAISDYELEGALNKVRILDARSHGQKWGEIHFNKRYQFPFERECPNGMEAVRQLGYRFQDKIGETEVWVKSEYYCKGFRYDADYMSENRPKVDTSE